MKEQKASIGKDLNDSEKIAKDVEAFVAQQFYDLDALLNNKQASPMDINNCLNLAALIDVLQVFNAETEDWDKKRKYMKKWAIILSKNIKNYGNPNGEPEINDIQENVHVQQTQKAYDSPKIVAPNVQQNYQGNKPDSYGQRPIQHSSFSSTNKESNLVNQVQAKIFNNRSREVKESIN